jgi:hypothetical protein
MNLVQLEEAKRRRMVTPAQEWKLIQSAIKFADTQQPVSRCSPRACKSNEARILKRRGPAG